MRFRRVWWVGLSVLLVGVVAWAVQAQHPSRPTEPAREITNTLGMKLRLIPAGEFLIGSDDSDQDAFPNEKPRHRVKITRPFYLGVTEVTQGQYKQIVANPSGFKGSDDLPVEDVSWNDAVAYCNKLSERRSWRRTTRSAPGW